jgi:hypothetical protein
MLDGILAKKQCNISLHREITNQFSKVIEIIHYSHVQSQHDPNNKDMHARITPVPNAIISKRESIIR